MSINRIKRKPSDSIKPFIFAPPNLTGSLHMGHAVIYTAQSIVQNIYQAFGDDAQTLLGFDHGGIMTQLLYNKRRDEGLSIEEFTDRHRLNIHKQLIDINFLSEMNDDYYVTTDENLKLNAEKVFLAAKEMGMVYEKETIISFDTTLETAVSDIEVVINKIRRPIYTIKYYCVFQDEIHYPIFENYFRDFSSHHCNMCSHRGVRSMNMYMRYTSAYRYIKVQTTKPETILADRAIITNKKLLSGCYAINPLTWDKIPILYHPDPIDKELGDFIKITPCCDKTDWNIVNQLTRRSLDEVFSGVLDANNEAWERVQAVWEKFSENTKKPYFYEIDNTINPYYLKALDSRYAELKENKLKVWDIDLRVKVASLLDQAGHLLCVREIDSSIPCSSRTQLPLFDRIERCLFIKFTEDQKDLVISNLRYMNIKPTKYYDIVTDLVRNFKEWCISRTISWGQRIPGYEDFVFDTWFNSSSIPHHYYSVYKSDIDTCITGQDIIFFWVVRMMLVYSIKRSKPCFKSIFLNGLITDESGQKMSKSKGNDIKPQDIIERYGLETFRFLMLKLVTSSDHTRINKAKIDQVYKIDKKFHSIINYVKNRGGGLLLYFYLHSWILQLGRVAYDNNLDSIYHIFEKYTLECSKRIIPNDRVNLRYKVKCLLLIKILSKIIYGGNIPLNIYSRLFHILKRDAKRNWRVSKRVLSQILQNKGRSHYNQNMG